jgi:tetratricopeptide (TPR) repeat protein
VPKRIIVVKTGLVVAVEDAPDWMPPPPSKGNTGGKAEARKGRKSKPAFKPMPSSGSTAATKYTAAALARRRAAERRRREKETEVLQARAATWARRQTEEKFRAVERTTDFEEGYALGVTASKVSPPNYPLAIVAFSKAYRLDPRRKVKRGRKPDPGLFEVPTRLAAAYRLNGQLDKAQKIYEWVLEHHDNRFARVGLAAVHEDNGKHVEALKLYQSVLNRHPGDSNAMRGMAKTLARLGRGEEAREAYKKALRASGG